MTAIRLVLVIAVLWVALGVALTLVAGGVSPPLDCGPEGKPALGGTACIDREPASLEWPP